MSKKVKMALGVAAAIAIPFAAPYIATTGLGLTGASAILGSAGVGALGGALSANLMGGDWRKGAAMGAVSGGVAGYAQAPAPQTGLSGGDVVPGLAAPGAPAGVTPTTPYSGPTSPLPGLGGGPVPPVGGAPTAALPASVADTTGFLGVTPTATGVSAVPGATAPLVDSSLAGLDFTSPYTAEFGAGMPAEPGLLSRFGEAIGGPSVYVPAGLQLGAAYMGQQQAADEQKKQEQLLRKAQEQEQALFARREALSKSLQEQAEATNPEYFGLQSARRLQEAGALATQQAQENVPFYKPGLRMAEGRRGQLATARATGTGYDVGYGQGVEQKKTLTQGAIEAMGSAPQYSSLANYYGGLASGASQGGLDIGRLFGDITGRYEAAQRRREEEMARRNA